MPRNIRRSIGTLGVLAAIAVALNAYSPVRLEPAAWAAQLRSAPGSAVRGERLLTTGGCLDCHALNGRGGKRGPDLGFPSKTAATPALFAASVWNHAPAMIAAFQEAGKPMPNLSSADVADLFAFFYATQYFGPRGNAEKGGALFTDKQCATCHSEVLNTTRPRASLVEGWLDERNPSVWAERMWNHATEMEAAMVNRNIRWPNLSEQEVADILKFLSTRAGSRTDDVAFSVGEPELGETVFNNLCTSCHTLGKSEKSKVDLLRRSGPRSVTGYIAAMWNHGPEMRRRGGSTARIPAGKMPDLIAFLFTQRYFFEPGNTTRGEKVYEEKNCATCHSGRGAPDLTKAVEAYSPITLTAAVWRHGPLMLQAVEKKRLGALEFKGSEMSDLIAYLNSKLIVRVAR